MKKEKKWHLEKAKQRLPEILKALTIHLIMISKRLQRAEIIQKES